MYACMYVNVCVFIHAHAYMNVCLDVYIFMYVRTCSWLGFVCESCSTAAISTIPPNCRKLTSWYVACNIFSNPIIKTDQARATCTVQLAISGSTASVLHLAYCPSAV